MEGAALAGIAPFPRRKGAEDSGGAFGVERNSVD